MILSIVSINNSPWDFGELARDVRLKKPTSVHCDRCLDLAHSLGVVPISFCSRRPAKSAIQILSKVQSHFRQFKSKASMQSLLDPGVGPFEEYER